MRFTSQNNIDAVLGELARLGAKGEHLGPLFAALANELYTLADYALEHEQDPDGGAWRPLAPATRAQKLKRHGFARKLHESGELRERLETDSDPQSATVGTNIVSSTGYPYPAVQQFGANDGRIPARPFLPFDPESGDLMNGARDSLLELVRAHFESTV